MTATSNSVNRKSSPGEDYLQVQLSRHDVEPKMEMYEKSHYSNTEEDVESTNSYLSNISLKSQTEGSGPCELTPPRTPVNTTQKSFKTISKNIAKATILNINGKENDENNSDTSANNVNLLGRLEEHKKLGKEIKNFMFELGLNILDVILKSIDFVVFLGVKDEQIEYFGPLLSSLTLAAIIIFWSSVWRSREIYEMHFVRKHGFSFRWKKGDRIVGTQSGQDPRIKRDMKERIKRQKMLSSFQAFFCDLPWLVIGIFQGSNYVLNTFGILSVSSSAFGFGMKFASIVDLIKEGFKKKVTLYTVCPAEIKIGAGYSYNDDAENALESAYMNAVSEFGEGRNPSLVLIFMTANVEHEKALKKFNELTGGKVPFSGCTICRGAMMGAQCRQNDIWKLVSIWAISDPEGLYEVGMANLNNTSNNNEIRTVVKKSVSYTRAICKKKFLEYPKNPVIQGDPSFIWINPPPGPEDEIIIGVEEGIGSSKVEIIGGTSADNDVTGAWKQWNSRVGIATNGLAFVIAHCSAQVKGCAFTGYSATPKVGKVTKTNGPRHILTIDNKPAGEVYDEWTSGHYKHLWKDKEDSNILGPSSVYPLGQVVGQDWDNEDVYRTLHPHLLVKKDKSLTVFSDVSEGQEICMMTGTRENIQTKISAVATNVLRSTEIPTSELRGALVVFCAGAMMYCGTEGMDVACRKLDQALGGVNYLGIHTFGEQGPFPDGSVRHGNLMFSALVFSSRRKIMKLVNVDSDECVMETDPEFKEIALGGGIIGGGLSTD